MRMIATVLSMVFVCSAALAETPRITRVDVTDFGEYTLDVQAAGGTTGQGIAQRTVGNIKLLQQTRVIPLHKGVHFGFHFTLVGSPDGATVKLRSVTHYPPPGLQKPGASPIMSDESKRKLTIGESTYHGFTIVEDWMMMPGEWAIELWCGRQLLTTQTFTLVQ
ncbi:MAG: DUF3859 domain-containing protein [Terracidiphilus sp.]